MTIHTLANASYLLLLMSFLTGLPPTRQRAHPWMYQEGLLPHEPSWAEICLYAVKTDRTPKRADRRCIAGAELLTRLRATRRARSWVWTAARLWTEFGQMRAQGSEQYKKDPQLFSWLHYFTQVTRRRTAAPAPRGIRWAGR